MKYLILLPFLLIMNLAYGQYVTLEGSLKVQAYQETISKEAFTGLQLGYRFNEKFGVGIEYGYSRARFDIRMPNVLVRDTDWFGVLVNVLTVSNQADWTTLESKEVYKGYNREMFSYNLRFNFYPSYNWKIYVGPCLRYNSVMTEKSNEITFDNNSFSDLEFENFSNYGFLVGLDYVLDMERTYLSIGVEIQSDLYSTSRKIRGSDFIGKSFSYGLSYGFKIGQNHAEKPYSI